VSPAATLQTTLVNQESQFPAVSFWGSGTTRRL
jgi:hypothetical protein